MTYTAKKFSNSARQSGRGVHRMGGHLREVRNRARSAGCDRLGEYSRATDVAQPSDCGYFGQPYLQQVKTFNLVRSRIAAKHIGIRDDGVLAHRTVGWHLLAEIITVSGLHTNRQKLPNTDNRRLFELATRNSIVGWRITGRLKTCCRRRWILCDSRLCWIRLRCSGLGTTQERDCSEQD